MNRRLTVVATVVAVLAIIGIGVTIQALRDTTGEAGVAPTATATPTEDVLKVVGPVDKYGLAMGDATAPVKVEIFEDFLCPFCQQYEAASRESLRQYAEDGSAYVVYRPIAFLDEYSARALNALAVIMEKSGPTVALDFHDRLYDEQPAEGGTMPTNDWLIEQAVAVGANADDIRAGIDSYQFRQWIINGADDASKRRVNSTPTVFVNGVPVQGISIADLVQKTESAIENPAS